MIYKNIKIYVDEEKVIENGYIVEEKGLIKIVEEMEFFNEKQYEGKKIMDFSGCCVYPGFIDAHTHVGVWESGLAFEGADGNEETDPITPHLRAIDAVNPEDEFFFDALKNGITTVITGPGSANPIAGNFVALKTFGCCVDDMVIKDSVGIKFSLGENPKSVYNEKDVMPTTRMGVAAVIREQLEKARRYIKKMEEDEQDLEFDVKCEALLPLLKRKEKAFFHCHRADDIFTAIRIAKEFNLKFALIHATQGHMIANKLKGLGVIYGPMICDKSKPELRNFSEKSPSILLKNGVMVAICTDSPVVPVGHLRLSCALAIKEGLLKKDALKAITKDAAKICEIYDMVGSLKVGKMANFVVFEKEEDLFSIYSSPAYVIIDGKIVYEKK